MARTVIKMAIAVDGSGRNNDHAGHGNDSGGDGDEGDNNDGQEDISLQINWINL